MFKKWGKIGNHGLTKTSNNSENHEKSSLNLKKIDYSNKAKADFFMVLIYRLKNISSLPGGRELMV